MVPLLLLLLGEATARVVANEWSAFNMFIGAHREFHPERKVTPAPGYHSEGISINSAGFPGPELEPRMPEGGRRVVVLGDSVSFVPTDAPWPLVLERSLRETAPDLQVEVLNASCGGYASWQARHWYETEVDAYDHDMVIVFVGWTDMGQYHPDGLAFKMDEQGYLDAPGLLERAMVHCYLLRSGYLLRDWLASRRPVSLAPLSPEDEAAYAAFHPAHFEESLRAIVSLAERRARSVYVLDFPGLLVDDPTPDEVDRMHFPRGVGHSLPKFRRIRSIYESVVDDVVATTSAREIHLGGLFATAEARSVFVDTCHFDAAGAEIVGRHVAGEVVDTLRAPTRTGR